MSLFLSALMVGLVLVASLVFAFLPNVTLADFGELLGILGMLYGVGIVALLALLCILGTTIDLLVSLWRVLFPIQMLIGTDANTTRRRWRIWGRNGTIARHHGPNARHTLPILPNGARNRPKVRQ